MKNTHTGLTGGYGYTYAISEKYAAGTGFSFGY